MAVRIDVGNAVMSVLITAAVTLFGLLVILLVRAVHIFG